MSLRDYLYYEEPGIAMYCGDALAVLRELPDASAQTCITSPPYWGLRDYGTATWDGGDAGCDHRAGSDYGSMSDRNAGSIRGGPFKDSCGKCGARRLDAQLGLEPTPEQYVAVLVAVFREVRRVLREDGTLWLNLGDSYATGAGAVGERPGGGAQGDAWNGPMTQPNRMPLPGLKPKDLVGIPWRVAFALQADGWYLRSDTIWAKPNPMPESVTDRPTKSHEYLFLLAKAERYYYDADSIAEPFAQASLERLRQNIAAQRGSDRVPGKTNGPMKAVGLNANRSSYKPGSASNMNDGEHVQKSDAGLQLREAGRNKRSVWTVPTGAFKDAHFAVFPPDLIKPCVLAGAPTGGMALDPFAGAGTTLYVAKELGRAAIGIELNKEYAALAVTRLRQEVLPLGLGA